MDGRCRGSRLRRLGYGGRGRGQARNAESKESCALRFGVPVCEDTNRGKEGNYELSIMNNLSEANYARLPKGVLPLYHYTRGKGEQGI